MARKKNTDNQESWLDWLIELLLVVGGIYLLYRIFHTEDGSIDSVPGIHGPPRKRKFIGYQMDGKYDYLEELKKLSSNNARKAIKIAIQAMECEELKGEFVKIFQNDTITGELIRDQIRILYWKENNERYHLLTVFLKKSDDTEESYKQIARKRILRLRS